MLQRELFGAALFLDHSDRKVLLHQEVGIGLGVG